MYLLVMEKIFLKDIGKLFLNKSNNQTKIELKKRVLKQYGIKPEDIINLDITKEINKVKKVNFDAWDKL